MKKTMKTLLALMAGTLAFSACNNEDVLTNEIPNLNPEVEGIRTFTAFTESDDATRATIDGFDIKWQSGDAISVIDGSAYSKYDLSSGEGTTSGTFELSAGKGVSGSNIYAVYPYDDGYYYVSDYDAASAASSLGANDDQWQRYQNHENAREGEEYIWERLDNNERIQAYINHTPLLYEYGHYTANGDIIEKLYLAAQQELPADHVVAPKAVMMVAKADAENNFAFKNVCAYIKVTTTTQCKRIVVTANNPASGEGLSGTINVDISSGTPVITTSTRGNNVYIQTDNTYEYLDPGTYYIAVLPGTLSGGLNIKFYLDEENYTESNTTNSFTFERSKVYNGGSQPTPPVTKGTAEATIGGNTVNVPWIQLWPNGPKFAEMNVGATSVTDQGTLMYWAEATATGDAYVWGSNWCTPSKEDLEELVDAARNYFGNVEVACAYEQVEGVWGFKFTGKKPCYKNNSVFFPLTFDSSGDAYYWTRTEASEVEGYQKYTEHGFVMNLDYNTTSHNSWQSEFNVYLKESPTSYWNVRPVLK